MSLTRQPGPFPTAATSGAVSFERRSPPKNATTVARWLCVVITGVVSCGETKHPPPVAEWVHDQASWDMAKWQDACSPGTAPRVDGDMISWNRARLDTQQSDGRIAALVHCSVSFEAGRPLALNISISALPEEIPALIERPLGAMLTEVPPAVAAIVRELAASGQRGGKYVGAFAVSTYLNDRGNALQQVVDGRWAAEFIVQITLR